MTTAAAASSPGGSQRAQQQRQHRAPALHGTSEVAGEDVAEPGDVLHHDGLVERELLAQGRDRLRVGVQAQQRHGRIARHQPDQEERHHRRPEQDRDQREQPFEEIAGHGVFLNPGMCWVE
jgi:hypothetical protein